MGQFLGGPVHIPDAELREFGVGVAPQLLRPKKLFTRVRLSGAQRGPLAASTPLVKMWPMPSLPRVKARWTQVLIGRQGGRFADGQTG